MTCHPNSPPEGFSKKEKEKTNMQESTSRNKITKIASHQSHSTKNTYEEVWAGKYDGKVVAAHIFCTPQTWQMESGVSRPAVGRQTGTLQGPIWQVEGKGEHCTEPKITSFDTQRTGSWRGGAHLPTTPKQAISQFSTYGLNRQPLLPSSHKPYKSAERAVRLWRTTLRHGRFHGRLNCVRLRSVKTRNVSLNTQI